MEIRKESDVTDSRYSLLLEIVQAANSHLDLVRVLEAVTAAVRPVVRVDGAVVLAQSRDGLVRPASVFISPEASAPPAPPTVLEYPSDVPDDVPGLPFEGSLPEHVLETRATLLCPDASHAATARCARSIAGQFPFNDREPLLRHGVRSGVCVPLFARGEFLGCIFYARVEPPAFEAADAQLLEELTGPIVTALANVLAYRELESLRRALARHNRVLREEVEERGMFHEIVGRSSGLGDVLRRVERVASSETTVLILGETGTGKELIARAIHARSPRADRPLVSVNCAALAPGLVASELFGHERGSFTGATQRRVGRFELAAGGTLFLDEIGELPPEVQVALLRVLQEREYERVGGDRPVRADVRVLAATHRDLRASVAAGSFREDLYYRLSVFPIVLPPLRERRQDIAYYEKQITAFETELDALDAEMEQASAERKARLTAKVEETQRKLRAKRDELKSHIAAVKREGDAKMESLRQQITTANQEQKKRLESRLEQVRADYEQRSAKLHQAWELTKSALVP